jgi:hypothetical protein
MTRPREAQLELLLSISEGLRRGTDEWLKVSPKGDAMHPPSCGLAIRDGVEEIKWLRAEVERLKLEPETLRAELIAICNVSRAALANAYDRARESRKALEAKP